MIGRRSTLCALLGLLVAAAPAHADSFTAIFGDYQADGQISPCRHSADALTGAKGRIPNDIEQYAPDFPAALDAAIEARSGGACGAKPAPEQPAAAAPAPAPPPPASAPPAAPAAPADPPSPTPEPTAAPGAAVRALPVADTKALTTGAPAAPAPLVGLGIVGGLLGLAALLYALARWSAWEPRWMPAARHACAEAGYRAGASWEDFRDWSRSGR